MTFGSASVDPTTQASYGSIALWDERNEPALRELAPPGQHPHGRVRRQPGDRTRFGREVLEAVRAAVSDDFIVGLRMAVDQYVPGDLGPEDMPSSPIRTCR